jgi:glucose/arabinose dehydrogenase
MRRTSGLAVALLLVTVVAGASPAQPAAPPKSDPWLVKTAKFQFQPQKAADAAVQLDLPKKDWMALPSSGSVLLVIASRKGDAVVLVERSSLQQPLQAEDITDLFAQIETDAIKERQPKAADFQSRVLDSGERRLVAVQYARPGVLGAEKVRQYSIPVGKQLYRVTCISSAAQFAAYDPVFAHVAASFTTTE